MQSLSGGMSRSGNKRFAPLFGSVFAGISGQPQSRCERAEVVVRMPAGARQVVSLALVGIVVSLSGCGGVQSEAAREARSALQSETPAGAVTPHMPRTPVEPAESSCPEPEREDCRGSGIR